MIIDGNIASREEQVRATLEEEILTGKLTGGTSLTEQSLSKRLGVSRTPIRAALHKLSEEGLVSIVPNKGAVVVGVSRDDLIDIYNMRMRLEGLASATAASRITPEDLSALRESVELAEAYIKDNDPERLKTLDTEFHSIIYRASGSRMLNKTLSELHRNITSYRKMSLSVPGRLENSVREHREILEAIESGNADLADRLTSRHVAAALENMLLTVES